jgi:sulfite reductase beta subunit-like hemoprotein
MDEAPSTPAAGESKVEIVKKASRGLRGTLAETLASDASHFSEEEAHLLKFHGSYQQDDRDLRHARRQEGRDKAWQFMVRTSLPGGVLSAEQYLALDRFADDYANGTLRVTTRQGLQFHGVVKADLKPLIASMNRALVTTISACGDVSRNVMACPAPLHDEAHQAVRALAREIAAQLRPATRAYHEIWLDGEKAVSTENEEPFYGDRYLPRKFKVGVSLAEDNTIDIYSYDAGLIALVEDGRIPGFNLLVGGGLGMTHNKSDTYARLASPLGFVETPHAVEAVRTIAAIFRDHGNRADRRHARLKYLLDQWGLERFRGEFRTRAAFPLHDWRPIPDPVYRDYLGRNPQGDGRFFYGVFVANGRIQDRDGLRLKTAFRRVVERHRPAVILTPSQNVLFANLDETAAADIERILLEHGAAPAARLSAVRRYSMACPALPTCGLALGESERLMPSIVDRFEAELTALGLRDVPITLRMTGCPNGCARPYTADIALVGRGPDVYHVFVGGSLAGNRLADLYAADVPTAELVDVLRPLLKAWAGARRDGEGLGDFYQRLLGNRPPRGSVTGKETPTRALFEGEIRS